LPAAWDFRVGLNFAHRVMAVVLTGTLCGFAWRIHIDRGAPLLMRLGATLLVTLLSLQILLGAEIIWTLRAPDVTTGHVAVGALLLATTFLLTWLAHRDRIEAKSASRLMIATAPKTLLADYVELTKPRLSALSVLTALVGYLAARPAHHGWKLVFAVVGTACAAGGVAALNQYMEWDTDALMRRTADRPIPSGKVATGSAFVLGLGLVRRRASRSCSPKSTASPPSSRS
jgi:heme A synthase